MLIAPPIVHLALPPPVLLFTLGLILAPPLRLVLALRRRFAPPVCLGDRLAVGAAVLLLAAQVWVARTHGLSALSLQVAVGLAWLIGLLLLAVCVLYLAALLGPAPDAHRE